jgi:hypothetical protein
MNSHQRHPVGAVEEALADDEQVGQRPQHAAAHHDRVERHPLFLPHLSTFGYELETTPRESEGFGVHAARGALDPAQIFRWFEDQAEPARTPQR